MFNFLNYAYREGYLNNEAVSLLFLPFVTKRTVETVNIIVEILNNCTLQ